MSLIRPMFKAITATGVRSFSTSSVSLKRAKYIKVSTAAKFPDLSKIDPIYDDVEENKSVIDLWRRQLMQKKGIVSLEGGVSQSLESELNKQHGIQYPDVPYKISVPENEVPYAEQVHSGDELLWTRELGISLEDFSNLTKKVLLVRRTVQMTRKGKIPSLTVLVVVGNTRGSAGYGEGKDSEIPKAIIQATRKAIKNMQYFHRYDDRTIHHNIFHKFKASKLYFWARKPGFGVRVSPIIHEICKCIGITDLGGKCRGSKNPMNVIKGTFEALGSQRTQDYVSRARGIRMVDVQNIYYGGATKKE